MPLLRLGCSSMRIVIHHSTCVTNLLRQHGGGECRYSNNQPISYESSRAPHASTSQAAKSLKQSVDSATRSLCRTHLTEETGTHTGLITPSLPVFKFSATVIKNCRKIHPGLPVQNLAVSRRCESPRWESRVLSDSLRVPMRLKRQ